jgi:hypothetical protein
MSRRLEPYVALLSSYLEGAIHEREFEERFRALYLEQDRDTAWSEQEFAVLDQLFGDVEEFEPDPVLRRALPRAVDDVELRGRVMRGLEELLALKTS